MRAEAAMVDALGEYEKGSFTGGVITRGGGEAGCGDMRTSENHDL